MFKKHSFVLSNNKKYYKSIIVAQKNILSNILSENKTFSLNPFRRRELILG